MNIPKYWARANEAGQDREGHPFNATVWRWSNLDVDDARHRALEGARQLADRFRAGDVPRDRYALYDRPVREEIVEEFTAEEGSAEAVITRNSYGCLVLNTARVAFVDVDIKPEVPGAGLVRLVMKLFGQHRLTTAEQADQDIQAWIDSNPSYSGRLYRTCAGYRLMITNQFVEPTGETARRLLDELNADSLYCKLCTVQECFRARLTPKYWRCEGHAPPSRYPWETTADEQAFRSWQTNYEQVSFSYATCHLVREFGNEGKLPVIQRVQDLHDEYTRVQSKLPLA